MITKEMALGFASDLTSVVLKGEPGYVCLNEKEVAFELGITVEKAKEYLDACRQFGILSRVRVSELKYVIEN